MDIRNKFIKDFPIPKGNKDNPYIILFDSFSNGIMENNFVIMGTFIMTLEFELFTYLSIWNAKKETRQLLKGSK